MQRAQGLGRISTAMLADGSTRLDRLYQDGCAKIRLPRTHVPAMQAVLINTAGGLTGGDRLEWHATAAPGTRLVLTTQTCERIYRSTGGAASVATALRVGSGAHVDWLPQETILFDKAVLERTLDVDLEEKASATLLEAVILGREAMGEDALSASLVDRWRIRREGRLLHAEQTGLEANEPIPRHSSFLLSGARAFATLLHVSEDAERRVDELRRAIPDGSLAGASVIGEKLVFRALAPSGFALRKILAPAIAVLSGAGSLPRLWSI